jgi:gliding motility-associated-like protein
MRHTFIGRLALLVVLACVGFAANAQITIDNTTFFTGNYGQGSSISAPIQIASGSCINTNNTFQLYLCNPTNPAGVLIGSYGGFYGTFVNGIIPNGTAARTDYYLVVKASNPALTSTQSSTFSVVSTAGPVVKLNASQSARILKDQEVFGYCTNSGSGSLTLLNQSTAGSTVTSSYKDEKAPGNTTNLSFGGSATISLGSSYYTLRCKADVGGVISSISYLLVNTTNNLSLQTNGEQRACLPDTLQFSVNISSTSGGIGTNYPGSKYAFSWGDGSQVDTLTYCQLISDSGLVKHGYSQTSCGNTATVGSTTYPNAFNVDIKYINPFQYSAANPNNCDQPSVATFSRIFKKPVADFTFPNPSCQNSPVLFTNTSQPGLGQSGNNCTSDLANQWFINGNFIDTTTNLTYTFTLPGKYEVMLIVDNGSCAPSIKIDSICIAAAPVADFSMNGLSSNRVAGCAPLVVTLSNLSATTICSPTLYQWNILDSATRTPAPASAYTITPNATAQNPIITFNTPGHYIIQLVASNASCPNSSIKEKFVEVLLDADVNLPGNQSYCGVRTINFQSSGGHVVTYNATAGTLSYQWTITGGSYSFVGSTSATSAYPQVQFNDFATYIIKVKFTNDCGVDSATQQILFYQPVTINAGTDQNVCYTINSVNLTGSSSGPAGYTAVWSVVPGFGTNANISNVNATNPTYTFTATDKTNGVVKLLYTGTPPSGSACPPVTDTVFINIFPDNAVTSANSKTICSGSNVAYTINALLPGSTFTWTSSVTSGTATGNTASGTVSPINDVLTNTSTSTDAVVRYVIIPSANGCTGNAFNLDVTVKPIPTLTPTPSATTLCSGDQLTINLASSLAGAQYTWGTSISGGTLTGNSNQATPTATTSVVNTLVNTGTTDVTLTYTVVAYNTGTPVCTGQSQQVIVTIKPPVNASASGNSPICAGQTINLTGGSTNAGATFSWTGPNGFTSNQQSPSISNAIPAMAGTYTLVTTAGGCPSAGANTNIVVNTTATIAGASSINPSSCGSATGSITLNGLSNNTSYTINYTFNGNPATPVSLTSNGSGSLTISNLPAGTYNNITAGINGCGSNAIGPITLSDPSAPNTPVAGSNSPICSGNTLTLNASTTSIGTATYTWSGPNSFSSSTQNPTIANATIAATGTYNVTVTINNCTSAAGTVNVLVNQTPVTPVAGNNGPICTGGTLNLTSNSATGGVSYAWTGPNGFTNGTQNPSINNVTLADAGVYSVTATLGSCTSAAGTTTVAINPTPNISTTAKTDPTNCASATGSITLNGLSNNTSYSVTYTYNGNPVGPVTLGSTGSGSVVIPNLTAGIYDNITVSVNGCTSNAVGPITLSDPAAPNTPTAGSNSPLCSGTTLNLTASTTSLGVASYTWSGPNSFTSTTQNPSIANITTAGTGTYNVTVTINSCTSAAGSVAVVVNQTPVTPIAGSNTPVCTGNTLTLTSSTTTPGVISYTWSGPNGFTNNTQNPSVNNVTLADAGTYSVTATLGTCTSAAATTNVAINPTPNISGSSSTDPTNCATATGSITLTGLTASTAYNVHYTQNGTPVSVVISTNASGALTIASLPAGAYTNVSVDLNGCPSNVVGPFTLSDPTPPAVPIAGSNGPICSGNNLQLTANSATSGVSYTWSGPNGFTNTTQNPVINNATVAAAGLYSVTATLNSCTSAAGTVNVVINPTPVTPTAGSNSPVCSGGTLNLTASTPSTGVTYSWTGPNGFTNTQQNPSISNVSVAAAGSYVVVATTTIGACPSAPGGVTVTINPTPNITGSSATNPTNCASATGSITLTGLTANTSYTVNYNQGATPQTATLLTDATGALVIPNLASGTYSNITVTLNGCPSNVVGPFTLVDPTPPATPVAGSNGPICSGNTLNLNASTTSTGTATWSWTGPNGFNSANQNPSITNATVAATGTYIVTVTINSCTSAAGSINVVVNQTPATPVVTSNTPVCTGNTLNLGATTTTPGTMTWDWTGPNSFTSAVQNPSITNITLAANGTYTVVATATTGNCPSAPANVSVVINPTPNITTTSFTDPTNCNTATGSITLNGLTASTSYTVQYDKNSVPQTATLTSNGSGSIVIPNLTAGTYSNIKVVLTGCPSNLVGPITLTDPNPPAPPTAGSNSPICSGNTLNLTASTTSVGAITYTWSGPNGFSDVTQNPSIPSATVAATGTYSVTATLNSCVSLAGTVSVVVNQTPATPVASSNSPVCSDSTLNLSASTTFPGAVTWTWSGPNGFASSSQNPSIASVTTLANGTYSVIATSTVGTCPSATATTTVVVNPTPVISSSSFTNPTQCFSSTGTIVLNGLTANTTYTVTYTKNGNPVTTTITSDAAGVVTIPNLPASIYANIRVTTLAGCPSNSAGPYTLSDPNPPATPVAGSNSPICTGSTLNLTASTSTTGAIIYAWSGPNSFTSAVQNPTIINAQPNQSGWYYVSATLNNCTSLKDSVLVDIATLPAGPAVTSPVNYCINTTAVPLTATALPGNTLRWYTLAVGGSFSTSAPTPSTATIGTTDYYVSQVTALGCEGARSQIQVIVNPDAIAQYTASPTEACAPFVINSSVIQPTLYPTRNGVYQWYANGVLIGTGTTFPGYTIALPGDSVLIKLKTISLFGCKNDSTERWMYTTPKPVTDFTASDTVGCGPLSVAFTNTTPLITHFNYIWNFGNGVTSTLTQPGTIVFAPNPRSGDTVYHVRLTAFTLCDTITKTLDIRVKSKPQSLFTPSTTYGCSPLPVTFTNTTLGTNVTYVWDFGDGSATFTTTNNLPASHVYHTAQQDTFHVKLIATNECGSDTATYAVVVAARTINLNFAVNGNQITGCAPHTVNFINNSTGATNFVWSFGDGNIRSTTKNIDTVTTVYSAIGSFVVTVKASNGCTDTTGTITINVYRKPIPDFSVNPLPACIGDTLHFTNQTDTATNLLWQFGNGVTSQLTNPQYAYTAAGTYNVKLIAVRQYGPGNSCSDSITKAVSVVASLPGSFSVSDSVSTCIPFSVIFTNHSLPSSLTTWNFGDGNVDTGDIVSHTFTQVGTFTVTMTARDLGGCKYIATKQIIVNGPAGAFIYDHGYVCGKTPVRFEATVTGTDSIRWNFGDGASITTTNNVVYHVYAQAGLYVPTVRLLAGTSCNKFLQGVDTIKVDYIKAGFTSNPAKACGSTTVSFTDTSRAYFGLQSWQWNFGDGNTSGVRNPVHSYSSTNTWPVRLITTGVSGCADTSNVPVFVKVDSKPIASIVAPTTGCVNQPVLYNSVVVSSDPVTYYSWVFSNGATANTPQVNNNYAAAGTFNARLIVGTSFGCYDTTNQSISINPSPFVFANPDMIICRGQSAQLNATGGLTYDWSPFTGLSCTTCSNPVATPLTTTQYVVTGYNSYGCAARDTVLITVPQPIDVIASGNTSICVGGSTALSVTGATTYVWSPAAGLSCTTCANPIANPANTTIYRVIGFDAYNCFQDTAYVAVGVGQYPVVNVGPDKVLATGSQFILTPTAATNGPIALWAWTPANDLSCANCPTPTVTAKKDICYTVKATNFFGCSGSDTMCIKVFCESSQVFIPNAFTPDGDGVNDVLVVKAKGIKLIKSFRIFNRWGQVVFEKGSFIPNTDSYGWDGKVKGIAAPPDVYVYTCEVVCEDDTPYTYKGNVAIIK